jgi:hypothetical protein
MVIKGMATWLSWTEAEVSTQETGIWPQAKSMWSLYPVQVSLSPLLFFLQPTSQAVGGSASIWPSFCVTCRSRRPASAADRPWVDVRACAAAGVARAGVLECRVCRRQAGLLVGTVMERSHTPLSVWFWAACLVARETPGSSSAAIGLTRYETAFGILHKLRAGMVRPADDWSGYASLRKWASTTLQLPNVANLKWPNGSRRRHPPRREREASTSLPQ